MGIEVFNQLMLTEDGLTVAEQQFRDTHTRICYNAQKSAEHWVEMASGIKEMRDGKLYKAAGFETFGEYTESALNLKERQAYNYVAVLERLPQEFLRAHAAAGMTKLLLLTSTNEAEREEIIKKIDLEKSSVREVSEEVKEAIAARDKAEEQLALEIEKTEKAESAAARAEEERKAAQETAEKYNSEYLKLANENAELKKKVKDAENVEATVIYQADEKQAAEIVKQREEIAELRTQAAARESETLALKRRLAEMESARAEKPKAEIKGNAVAVFKSKFEDFQDLLDSMNELIGEMEDEQKTKCKNAVKAVFAEQWN